MKYNTLTRSLEMSKEKKDSAQKGESKVKMRSKRDRRPKMAKNGLTKPYDRFLRRVKEGIVTSRIEPIKALLLTDPETGETTKKERHRLHHTGASRDMVTKSLKLGDVVFEKTSQGKLFKLTEAGLMKLVG